MYRIDKCLHDNKNRIVKEKQMATNMLYMIIGFVAGFVFSTWCGRSLKDAEIKAGCYEHRGKGYKIEKYQNPG